ncbi:hypothetical protein ACJMK2_032384, partial [Sinanodonta woodiana]
MKNNDQLDMEMSRLNKARDEYHYFGDNRKTGLFWKPYWQRKNGQNENRSPTSTLSRNYRLVRREATLHQSYQDLRSHRSSQKLYLPKSVSMGGLHSTPYVLQNTDMNKKSHSNNILAFSKSDSSLEITMINPSEVEERGERNNDESNEASQPCANQNESAEKIVQKDENEDEEENDIYLSDDDPVVSRENLDKAGTYLVEHDWMLKNRLEKDSKRLIRSHKKLRIPIPDDDPLDTIQNRLEEISLMVKSKAKRSNQLDTMDQEQRTRIMVRFSLSSFFILYLHVNEAETAPGALKRMKEKTDWENQNTSKSSLGMEMQLALSTQPEYRSPADLKR